ISEGVFIDNPKNISLGNNVWIDKDVVIISGELTRSNTEFKGNNDFKGKLIIGDNAHIGIRTVLQAHGGIKIGNYFTSGCDTKIYSLSNHVSKSKKGTHSIDQSDLYYTQSSIIIENNVWCGINSIILNGPIGNDVFIQANSVVTSQVPQNSIVSGNPARIIKTRFK
ncbi:MAG TPA: acyltransferase, partial [Saprospiraceae bacterium]|nr:acyltransferase [Saprospiraceae bacterium]